MNRRALLVSAFAAAVALILPKKATIYYHYVEWRDPATPSDYIRFGAYGQGPTPQTARHNAFERARESGMTGWLYLSDATPEWDDPLASVW